MTDPPEPSAPPGDDAGHDPLEVTATLDIAVARQKMHIEIRMDAAPKSAAVLIPIGRALNEAITGRVVEVLEAGGRTVSCQKGCGACCRQAVPISIAEARAIHALVAAMPEARQSAIRERFAAAREKLNAAGLLDHFSGRAPQPERKELGELDKRYWRLQIPCPFLEDESCSIHPERPLVCREYLVTSPASACADVHNSKIEGVPVPAAVPTAMMLADPETAENGAHWIALATALDWVDAHPAPDVRLDGQKLLQHFLSQLFQRDVFSGGMLDAAR